jgi:S-(hydroxymethyl)glutathione dehydrogenase/alcohol dehydrogenase
MFFKAAVLLKKNTIKILKLKKPILKPHQVFVKIIYSSICHTQLQEIKGMRGKDKFLPHCLGHEGVGKIIEKHKSVKKFKKGDLVCLSWIKGSGQDSGGVTYEDIKGNKINGGPVHTFNEYAAISQNRLYKLKRTINLKTKVLFGCALSTSYNALNNISLKNSKTICIIGAGGLGLSTVIIAKELGYKKIIIIDKIKKKLNIALKLGATHILDSLKAIDFKSQIDVTVECTGNIDVLKNSILIPRKFGGKLIFIGNYPNNSKLLLDPWIVIQGVTLLGAWNDLKPFDSSFKKLEKLLRKKNLDIFFGNKIYKLENIMSAIKDFESSKIIRPLIKL